MPPDTLAWGLLWLLLPAAAASGWWVARRELRRESTELRPDARPNAQYVRGINYLLNEQPDKAIEVFINLLDVQSETVETHLALGNLFRRRGEVDRAIRIHQNLMARSNLNKEQRCLALFELAMDYMRSGLLDRAESLFRELVELGAHTEQALRHLLAIYQQEGDWQQAIDCARRLAGRSADDVAATVAQLYCESAREARASGEEQRARHLLEQALAEDPRCVRATLMLAELDVAAGDLATAASRLENVERQDPAYLPEALPMLRRCREALGQRDRLAVYLEELAARHGAMAPALMRCELAAADGDTEGAIDHLTAALQRQPSVHGLDRLVELALAEAGGDTRRHFEVLKRFTERLLQRQPSYRCGVCGFSGRTLHWLCPSCKNWNTVKPLQGIPGE